MERADCECQQLGFTDVASVDLLRQCADENHGTSSIHSHGIFLPELMESLIEFARELVQINDSPALELVCFCSVIPLEMPKDDSARLFHDSAEQEAFDNQCMFNARWRDQ